MIFKKSDYIICIIKKFNFNVDGYGYYDVINKKGIISGTFIETSYGKIMYLVKLENGDQRYFYEENIKLDIAKMREIKLKDIGI
jgi:hypothetical protein